MFVEVQSLSYVSLQVLETFEIGVSLNIYLFIFFIVGLLVITLKICKILFALSYLVSQLLESPLVW